MAKKIFITLSVIAVIAIGVFVYLGIMTDKRQEIVKIGVIFPLTGERSSVGISAKKGIDLAVEEINANAYL